MKQEGFANEGYEQVSQIPLVQINQDEVARAALEHDYEEELLVLNEKIHEIEAALSARGSGNRLEKAWHTIREKARHTITGDPELERQWHALIQQKKVLLAKQKFVHSTPPQTH